MKLSTAYFCLDCETIFEGTPCPSCASRQIVPVSRFIKPVTDYQAEVKSMLNTLAANMTQGKP